MFIFLFLGETGAYAREDPPHGSGDGVGGGEIKEKCAYTEGPFDRSKSKRSGPLFENLNITLLQGCSAACGTRLEAEGPPAAPPPPAPPPPPPPPRTTTTAAASTTASPPPPPPPRTPCRPMGKEEGRTLGCTKSGPLDPGIRLSTVKTNIERP